MTFIADKEKTKKKQIAGDSCNNPFCSVCMYRASRRDTLKVAVCMKYIEIEHEKAFIFLHLTAPNVTGDKLPDEVNRFNNGFKKMFERKNIKAISKGYIRKLEITYNGESVITQEMWDGDSKKKKKPMADYFQKLGLKVGDLNPNYDTYHTHFHIIVAVNKSYFKSRDYIKQKKWLNIWREAMATPEITQVFVQRVRLKNNDAIDDVESDMIAMDNGNAINEIAKYTAKCTDYMINQDVFNTFYIALKNRQKITYNGIFAEANKLFKAKKLDKYKDIDEIEYIHFLFYLWDKREYVKEHERELTDEEYDRYNEWLVDEIGVE